MKTNNIYVGESRNIGHRISRHKWMLKNGTHFSRILQDDWNNNGSHNFTFGVIEHMADSNKEERVKRESYWIEHYNGDPDYNVVNVCFGDTRMSEEGKASFKKKMSERMSGENHPMWGKEGFWKDKKRPAEFSYKISNALKGHTVTEESRKKMSEAKLGKEPPNKFQSTPEILEEIKFGMSAKEFADKYGYSKNTWKRIRKELKQTGEISDTKLSKYKGVTFDKGRNKWRASFRENGKTRTIGRFDTEDEAYNMILQKQN